MSDPVPPRQNDAPNPNGLSHLDARGAAHLVDVGAKKVTRRKAVAHGFVAMRPETLAAIVEGTMPKGDVLATARIAGIMAAKKNAELIPLCHPLPIDAVAVDLQPVRDSAAQRFGIEIRSTVEVEARTGAEMEALCAAAVSALTVYDMCKAIDRGMEIGEIYLEYKAGGKSGVFQRI